MIVIWKTGWICFQGRGAIRDDWNFDSKSIYLFVCLLFICSINSKGSAWWKSKKSLRMKVILLDGQTKIDEESN